MSQADFHHVRADKVAGVPTFDLDNVDDFTVTDSQPVGDIHLNHFMQKDL